MHNITSRDAPQFAGHPGFVSPIYEEIPQSNDLSHLYQNVGPSGYTSGDIQSGSPEATAPIPEYVQDQDPSWQQMPDYVNQNDIPAHRAADDVEVTY